MRVVRGWFVALFHDAHLCASRVGAPCAVVTGLVRRWGECGSLQGIGAMRKLVLRSFQSPGDMVMLAAAVRDLHAAHPGRYATDVRTSADAIWLNNPRITALREREAGVETLDMHYPLIHHGNQRPYHFLHGYAQYLEDQLGVRIPLTRFAGDVHLADEEKSRPPEFPGVTLPERFWILVAGGKFDFTAKWWNPASYQAVVDHFRGRITFAQCGEAGHWHPPLDNVTSLVGQTTLRQFIHLMHWAEGVVCPVTLAMHLAAAVETRPGQPRIRPCVVIAGGREPAHWEAYPGHRFLSTNGTLSCCQTGGCWKSRCQTVGDGDEKDRRNLCEQPVEIRPDLRLPRCMEMITATDVIRGIEDYFAGGVLANGAAKNGHPPPRIGIPRPAGNPSPQSIPIPTSTPTPGATMIQWAPPTQPITPTAGRTDVLVRFRHGLGDAVQLTSVLRHLRALRPEWDVDVAALLGKHSAMRGLCRQVHILDRQPSEPSGYDQVFDLSWDECATCFADSPSTKAERCLRDVFGITPQSDLWGYEIQPSQEDRELARRYLERDVRVLPGKDGRYPVVLLHYEGNTSAAEKNLSHDTARRFCEQVSRSGGIPIILDWDRRSPLPDGKRIHNPHPEMELWRGYGTGDAGVLAALMQKASLFVGVDSGPLHVAAATTTPTLAVWTGHHPVHYLPPAEHITHLVPIDYQRLARGDRQAGQAFFERHYRFEVYSDLAESVTRLIHERLAGHDGALAFTRSFWIRANNAAQDLVVVNDIFENDSYQVSELPMPAPVVVDIGAHIGCFAAKIHERNPLARIIAVECCPENIPALEKNVGGYATIVPAAVTYEPDVALLNAVFPNCATTGGSIVASRAEVERRRSEKRMADSPSESPTEYWADLRPLRTVTLEALAEQFDIGRIDLLKLDCEGSEFSILENTTLLARIERIVGEYHGRERFLKLVRERFADWELKILKDGELGTFWLTRRGTIHAAASGSMAETGVTPGLMPRRATSPTTSGNSRLLVSALKDTPAVSAELLLIENGRIVAARELGAAQPRGFTRLGPDLWAVDAEGRALRVVVHDENIELVAVSQSPLAREAHDLTVVGGRLVTASPANNLLACFDTRTETWSALRPWFPPDRPVSDDRDVERADLFHLNSAVHDGEKYFLSLFRATPKPPDQRWRDTDLSVGVIIGWGPGGFDARAVAMGIRAPHALRLHEGQLWWCDGFASQVARRDGWRSPPLGGFARGLCFEGHRCLVGLSKSRLPGRAALETCGIAEVDYETGRKKLIVELPEPYIEVYSLFAMRFPEREASES